MNCPICEGYILKPKRQENGVITFSCDNCHGALLSIIHYIDSSRSNRKATYVTHAINQIDDTKELINCPKCSGFMTKYKISNQTHNRLDLCFRCYETWIDSGEWQLLQQLELENQLPNIFSQEWQDKIVAEEVSRKIQAKYEDYFGADFEKIQQIKSFIDNHRNKASIIRYLEAKDKLKVENVDKI